MINPLRIPKFNCHKVRNILFLNMLLMLMAFVSHDSEKTMNMLLDAGDQLINSTSSVQLEALNTKITKLFSDEISDQTSARYFNFKGNLAIRRVKYSEALQHFKSALLFSQKSSDSIFELHAYFGLVTTYQDAGQHKKALPYVKKILNYIPTIPVATHKKEGLAIVANFYRSIGDANSEIEYINQCVSLDPNYSPCQLLKGNFKTRTDDLSEGLKILWTILLNDPDLNEMTTVYAIQTIIFNYISVSHYEKAEELIELLLQKTKDIGPRMTANFIALKGDLYKEKSQNDLAKEAYLEALKFYDGVQFESGLLKSLYIVDKLSSNPNIDFKDDLENRDKANEFINLDYSYDFINTLNTIIYSTSQTELLSAIISIKKGRLADGSKITTSDQGFVYDMIKRKALEFRAENIYNEYAQKMGFNSFLQST